MVRKPDPLKGNLKPGIRKMVGVGEGALRGRGMCKNGLIIRSEMTLIPGEGVIFEVILKVRERGQS